MSLLDLERREQVKEMRQRRRSKTHAHDAKFVLVKETEMFVES
jgi:hypothetical protein